MKRKNSNGGMKIFYGSTPVVPLPSVTEIQLAVTHLGIGSVKKRRKNRSSDPESAALGSTTTPQP